MDPDAFEICFQRSHDVVDRAREWVRGVVSDLPPRLGADITLLTHELVRNSLEHSPTDRVWISVVYVPNGVRVQVTDRGTSETPRLRPVERYSVSGRGLHWVQNLTDGWGVERRDATSVWFQVDLTEDSADLIRGPS
jgi:anti-sigma regulatory factor (Ser/Thr protein kinase)